MIANQRHLFDVPRDVAYFNCAASTPLLKQAMAAGQAGIVRKTRPWTIGAEHTVEAVERARALVGVAIDADAGDIALVPSAAYGLATAVGAIPLERGREALVLEDEFPALVYALRAKTRACGAALRIVPRPADGDWTPAVLAAIGPATGLVGLCQVNWLDGAMLDLGVIAAACRRVGAALVLDQSQAFGIVPFSAKAIDPDFAVGVGEKWLFGPYGISYLYVARRWQDAAPLEQGWASRVHGLDPDHLLDYDDHYAAGARRFDTDERFNYMLLPQALAGLQQVAAWGGPATIAAALKRTIESIAARAAALGLTATPAAVRAPHIVGLRGGTRPLPVGLGASLARRGVYASVRAGIVRVAPHLHNDERDIEALFAALAEALKQAA